MKDIFTKELLKGFYLILSLASLVLSALTFLTIVSSIKYYVDTPQINLIIYISIIPVIVITFVCLIFAYRKIAKSSKYFIGFKPNYNPINNKVSRTDLVIGIIFIIFMFICIVIQILFPLYLHYNYKISLWKEISLCVLYFNNILLLVYAFYRLAVE